MVYSNCCSSQVYDFDGYRREIYINEWDNKDKSRSLPAFSTGNLGPYNALEKAIWGIRDQIKETGIEQGIRFLNAIVNNATNVTLAHNGTIDLTTKFWAEYKDYLLKNNIAIDAHTVLEAIMQWIDNLGRHQYAVMGFLNLPDYVDQTYAVFGFTHSTVNIIFNIQMELQKHDAMLRNLMFSMTYHQDCLETEETFALYRVCMCKRGGCHNANMNTEPQGWKQWGVARNVNFAYNDKNVIAHGNLGSYWRGKVATNINIPSVYGWILDPTIMWTRNRGLYAYASETNARLLRLGDRRFALSQANHQQYAAQNSIDTNKDYLYEPGHDYETKWHADYIGDRGEGHGEQVDYHHDDAILS